MKSIIAAAALLAATLSPMVAIADDRDAFEGHSNQPLTLAVFGDWPYGPVLFNAANLLINSINADPKVRLVLHIGDIHSGSQPCTGAGLSPLPAGAAPTYNQDVFNFFEQLKDPVVYTPGDNEWTDCHKTRQSKSGAPLNELAAVRSVFFPRVGETLGGRKKRVLSQAEHFSRVYPTDAQFVENVMWSESRVVFATLNMPGSNNDGLTWTAPFTDETARTREAAQRTGAALRWLRATFAKAHEDDAKAVLIGLQANMWDTDQLVAGGDGLGNYSLFVHELANLAKHFKRPVLLINGDSHLFVADTPLADPTSVLGKIHGTSAVPNLKRITVQGSTNGPAEWLRLKVDPSTPQVFSWDNVTYCNTPLTACP